MACNSPKNQQWALASPTTSSSSSSRLRLMSGDRQDEASDVEEHETGEHEMLGHVRQLIVDLLVDDDGHRSPSVGLSAGTKHLNNNPEADDDAASSRERLLEEKLARLLMELAAEQDNLRLAANAGNSLLEELSTAREEVDTLHDELETAQADRDQYVRESQRLRDQIAVLETELQRYDAWDSTGQNALSHMQQLQQQRRSSLTSRSGSFNRTDSCERCASREVEMTQLEQRADELRRRCLELELAREREQQKQRELAEEITQLHHRNIDQHLETVRVQQDLESVTTQLEQLTQEVENVQAVRDTLRRTARRLETESEDLRARLAAREELVVKLEQSKARAATQLQVAENRTASAQAETQRVTETLEKLQKQLENALLQQQQQQSRTENGAESGSGDAAAEIREKETQDMDQLLEDATREVAALRLENRILRRQHSTEASPEGGRMRGRRRKTLCTGSPSVTAADVLALGAREPKKGNTMSASDSGNEVESITTPHSQLPPLEIETIKNDVGGSTGDVKKRRQMSLQLNWVDKAATSSAGATVSEDASAAGASTLEDKRSVLSLSSGGDLGMVEEKEIGDEQQTGVESSKVPSILKRRDLLNDQCVISGATEMNSPGGIEENRAMRRSPVGDFQHARVHGLPIDELRREAVESPPKSPLYLGLSFIACATAATAAGVFLSGGNRG